MSVPPLDPYAPPKHDSDLAPPAEPEPAAEWKPLDGLVRVATILLASSLLLSVVSIHSSRQQIALLERVQQGLEVNDEQAEAADDLDTLTGLTEMLIGLATVVVFCLLLPRANRNLRALGEHNLRFSPRGTVGWYFAPIANLWMPYRAMKELWVRSLADETMRLQRRSTMLLPLWWFTWLVSNWMSMTTIKQWTSEEPAMLITAHSKFIIGEIVGAPCALLVVFILHGLSKNQKQRATVLKNRWATPFEA